MDSSVAEGSEIIDRMSKLLPGLLALYGLTSLLHFMHNAVYLHDYPNLPAWLTAAGVVGAWLVVATIGVLGVGMGDRARTISTVTHPSLNA